MAPRLIKRLTRPDTPAPAFRFTDRDAQILAFIGQHRFATPQIVSTALNGSPRNIAHRLYLLWRAELLARPRQQQGQLLAHAFAGGAPLVYELARSGANFLVERGVPIRIDWTFRPGEATHYPHALGVAHFMARLARDCSCAGNIMLVDKLTLLDTFPDSTRASKRPFSIAVDIAENGLSLRKTNTPDHLFSLAVGAERYNFAYENDRASETISPVVPTDKSTIYRKLLVMFRAFEQRRFLPHWNFHRLRMITETSTTHRIAAMIDTQHHRVTHGLAASMFLYTDKSRLGAFGPLGPAWLAADHALVAHELSLQAERIAASPRRFSTERRQRTARLAKILDTIDGQCLVPHAARTTQ